MLTVGQNHNVKFKVNVMGTSSEPRVRVILGTSPELSFVANKDADDWVSNLSIPAHIEPGDYEIRIEVHLNNRLFTPIKKSVNVQGVELSKPVQVAPTELDPSTPPSMPAASSLVKNFTPSSTKITAPEMPIVQAKLPKVELKAPRVESAPVIPEPIVKSEPASFSLLSGIAKTPALPMRKRFESKKPVQVTPIRVKISEIDSITAETVSQIVEKIEPKKVERKKAKAQTPVKLVKEQLFYE